VDKVRGNNSTKINTERKQTYCCYQIPGDSRRYEVGGEILKREHCRKTEEILDH
jgi:hypothetical protein